MIVNYHTHTSRCGHASGQDEDYVLSATHCGLKRLGFSDHTPYLFPDGHRSSFRMLPDALTDYAASVRHLQEKYREQISIHFGVEAEYYPAHFEDTVAMLRDAGVEYMLLAQHFCGNEYDTAYNARPTGREEDLQRYCDQIIGALDTGLFTYLAHPDLINFVGEEKVYTQHMRRLCRAVKDCGLPLEYNFLGARTKRHYPTPRFWEIAAEEGCRVIFGCDAHAPEELFQPEIEAQATELVSKLGLSLVTDVPLRKI